MSDKDKGKQLLEVIAWMLSGVTLGQAISGDHGMKWLLFFITVAFIMVALFLGFKRLRDVFVIPKRIYLKQSIGRSLNTSGEHLLTEWRKYLFAGKDHHIWSLRHSVASKYFAEEKKDISGVADREARQEPSERDSHGKRVIQNRRMLVSNFVNYGSMVEALVKEAESEYRHKKDFTIFCFTTLTMPLYRWFNFHDGKYLTPGWHDYLWGLETLLNKDDSDRLVVSRCLLTTAGAPPGFETSRARRGKGETITELMIHEPRSLDVLKEEATSWIWETKYNHDYHLYPLFKREPSEGVRKNRDKRRKPPASNCYRDSLIREFREEGVDSEIITFLEQQFKEESPTYWILPEGMLDNTLELPSGRFVQLGKKFCEHFHTKDHFSFYKDISDWHDQFGDHQDPADGAVYNPPIPEDFFYVAMVEGEDLRNATDGRAIASVLSKHQKSGVFCLGGSVDKNLKTVHLHLVDREVSPKYFEKIETFICEVLEDAKPLTDLL